MARNKVFKNKILSHFEQVAKNSDESADEIMAKSWRKNRHILSDMNKTI